jgi:hypothetical protein
VKPLSEKELKAVSSMLAQANKYGILSKIYNELATSGEIVLDRFETYLKSFHSIEIGDEHVFKFLGAHIQSSLEAVLGMDTIVANLTIYHLIQEDGQLKKVKIVYVSFDKMGNTSYNDKFQEFIIGSIVNYLQFNLHTGLPLTKK